MKYIILCGGIGKRCNHYSLPKPLNYVFGKHMIEYILESIPTDEIYIIYNLFLEEYNFEEIVINLFKTKKIYFSKIDYLTRGAVESAYVGIQKFVLEDEPVVFLDNDNLHSFPNLSDIKNHFIGYSINFDRTNFSFIEIKDNQVTNIVEKVKISDNYCCGMYGFVNIETFKKYAKQLIENNNKTKNEFYFSQLYKMLIEDNEVILPILVEKTNHIGSYEEILNNKYEQKKLRICFDLDNTLVTYPTIPNDYTSVKPIHKNIELLKNLKELGHEIIIYTARRMKTHNHNIGKVTKDIAMITMNSLEELNIEYDEIIFGKPIADIYIDDRAMNPYINNISMFGIFNNKKEFIHNKIINNKYNTIKKDNQIIIKEGPTNILRGELFFYKNIPQEIKYLFPELKNNYEKEESTIIHIDYIEGIPLFYLYKNKLLTTKIIDDLFEILDKVHNTNYKINITHENINNNYFKKLKNRFNKTDYFFEDAEFIYNKVMSHLQETYSPQVTNIIHGDFWFSNIILQYNDEYKLIDMRGQVDNVLTLNGDLYYDYGKLYQSILGYDLILNNCVLDDEYINKIETYFLNKCKEKQLKIDYLKSVTCSLIFGTFSSHSIEQSKQKRNLWEFLKKIILD